MPVPGGQGSRVLFERTADLLSIPDNRNAPGNRVITNVPAGTKATLVDTIQSNGPVFYKVRLNDGRTGYAIFGPGVKVIKGQ